MPLPPAPAGCWSRPGRGTGFRCRPARSWTSGSPMGSSAVPPPGCSCISPTRTLANRQHRSATWWKRAACVSRSTACCMRSPRCGFLRQRSPRWNGTPTARRFESRADQASIAGLWSPPRAAIPRCDAPQAFRSPPCPTTRPALSARSAMRGRTTTRRWSTSCPPARCAIADVRQQ